MAASVPGRESMRRALGSNGRLGKLIRKLPIVVKVDDFVFVHGGVTPAWARLGVDGINQAVEGETVDLATDDIADAGLINTQLFCDITLQQSVLSLVAGDHLTDLVQALQREALVREQALDAGLGEIQITGGIGVCLATGFERLLQYCYELSGLCHK